MQNITVEISTMVRSFEVKLEVEASYGNRGIGRYEYWGASYRDDNFTWELEDVDWDKSKYTMEENRQIEHYINTHEDELLQKYEELSNDI